MRHIFLSLLIFSVGIFSAFSAMADSAAAPAAARSGQLLAAVGPTQEAQARQLTPDMEKALLQLDEFAQRRLGMICASIRPCFDRKDVIQTGTEYIARYLAVDMDSVTTDITPAQGSGAKYIGSIIYFEQIFESRGATSEEALAGEFELVRMRHITELFRYNRGKWID